VQCLFMSRLSLSVAPEVSCPAPRSLELACRKTLRLSVGAGHNPHPDRLLHQSDHSLHDVSLQAYLGVE
jgi:hypothetical protein